MERVEYENLKRRIEEQRQQDLAALERVWALSQANGALAGPNGTPSLPAKRTLPRARRKEGAKGKPLQAVRAAIENLSGTFVFSDVMYELTQQVPSVGVKRGTLKAILKKLSETGEVELVAQGIGRKPSQYRRKQQEKSRESGGRG